MNTYAIAGATGNTGSVVATELLARGEKVRVIVRDEAKAAPWRARGAEVAIADLADAEALTRALTGVAGAYLLAPPDMTAPDFLASRARVTDAIATAVRRARPARIVVLSSVGAQHSDGTGPIRVLHGLEQKLAGVDGVSFIRAAYFLDNWAGVLPAAREGVLPSFLPADAVMPMVSTRDIGTLAAQLLVQSAAPPPIVELSGSRDVSPRDVANAAADILGREVRVQELALDTLVPTFVSMGVSPSMAGLYREMLEGAGRGRVAFDGAGAPRRGTVELVDALRPFLSAAANH